MIVAGDGVATRRRVTCLITLNYPRLRCLHCLRLLVGPLPSSFMPTFITLTCTDSRVLASAFNKMYIFQLIILHLHPHFTRHVRKIIRKTIRILHVWKSADPQIRILPEAHLYDILAKQSACIEFTEFTDASMPSQTILA